MRNAKLCKAERVIARIVDINPLGIPGRPMANLSYNLTRYAWALGRMHYSTDCGRRAMQSKDDLDFVACAFLYMFVAIR